MYGEAVADGAMGADLNAMIINCCCSPSSCISRFNRFLSLKVIRLAHWRLSLVRAAKSSSDSLLCGTITPSTFSKELMAVTYLSYLLFLIVFDCFCGMLSESMLPPMLVQWKLLLFKENWRFLTKLWNCVAHTTEINHMWYMYLSVSKSQTAWAWSCHEDPNDPIEKNGLAVTNVTYRSIPMPNFQYPVAWSVHSELVHPLGTLGIPGCRRFGLKTGCHVFIDFNTWVRLHWFHFGLANIAPRLGYLAAWVSRNAPRLGFSRLGWQVWQCHGCAQRWQHWQHVYGVGGRKYRKYDILQFVNT